MQDQYIIHKQGFRYYIIPDIGFTGKLPYPDNFLSAFRKKRAENILVKLNRAWNDGYIKGTLDRV